MAKNDSNNFIKRQAISLSSTSLKASETISTTTIYIEISAHLALINIATHQMTTFKTSFSNIILRLWHLWIAEGIRFCITVSFCIYQVREHSRITVERR